MRGRGSHTHSPDEVGRHPLGIDHGLLGRDIPVQVLFVDTPEGAPVGAECRPTPVAGMTVDLAYAITISFPRPRPSAVAHGGVGGRAAVIALPLLRVQAGGLGGAAAGDAAVCVTRPTRARGAPWARPWPSRAATAQAWPAVAGSSRRRSLSAACRRPRRPDSGRPESALAHGTSAARGGRTGGL